MRLGIGLSSLELENNSVVKFLIAGSLSTLINFLIYEISKLLFFQLWLAILAGYLGGLIFSSAAACLWVFRGSNRRSNVNLQVFSYLLVVYVVGFILMCAIFASFSLGFGTSDRVAWFIGSGYAVLNNYLGSKFVCTREGFI